MATSGLPYFCLSTQNSQAFGEKARGQNRSCTVGIAPSGVLSEENSGGFYYQTISSVTNYDGDAYEALDVLAQQVGIIGIFSDWPATVTYLREL